MGRLFDLVVVVDWSAAARPTTGADSIWFCTHDVRAGVTTMPENPPTRHEAFTALEALLVSRAAPRILVGFDFPFGYPRGFAHAAGLSGSSPAWSAVWQHLRITVRDRPDNTNNRFEVASALNASIGDGVGPFWGTGSASDVTPWLSRTKFPGFPHRLDPRRPDDALVEHRVAEQTMRSPGRRPFSVWQLTGAGSVGSQAITGIPIVGALRTQAQFAERAVVWPFETGLCIDPTLGRRDAIVFAEVWPSSIHVDRTRHPVKDAAQVISLAEHLAALDRSGHLGSQFAPALDPEEAAVVVAEEGWILGAPARHRFA